MKVKACEHFQWTWCPGFEVTGNQKCLGSHRHDSCPKYLANCTLWKHRLPPKKESASQFKKTESTLLKDPSSRNVLEEVKGILRTRSSLTPSRSPEPKDEMLMENDTEKFEADDEDDVEQESDISN